MHYSPTITNSMSECKRTRVLLICIIRYSIIRFYSILFFYCCLSNKVFLTIEPPNATWWQRCSRLTRSKSIPRQRSSPSALGSPGAILLTAKLYLSTVRRRSSTPLLRDGEALSLSTAESRSSTPLLRDGEALSQLRKAEVLLLYCGTAKPYLSTLRQLLYYTERWQQK